MTGPGQRFDNGILNTGNILALVHINVFVLGQQLVALVGIRHDAVGDLFHVRIVNRSGFQLLLLILPGCFPDNQLKAPKLPLNHRVCLIVLFIQHGFQTLGCRGENTLGALHLVPDVIDRVFPCFGLFIQPTGSRCLVEALDGGRHQRQLIGAGLGLFIGFQKGSDLFLIAFHDGFKNRKGQGRQHERLLFVQTFLQTEHIQLRRCQNLLIP